MIFTDERRAPPRLMVIGLLAAGLLASAAAQARAADNGELMVDQAIFISPAGEAFSAPRTDPYPIVKWFNRMDKKGDGKVDIDAFRADALHVFDILDRNHDGMLDSAEIHIYEGYLVPIVTRSDTSGDFAPEDGKLAPNQGAAYFSLFQEPEPVTAADRNFDFRVSRQEFIDHADRHFHALDPADKGYITLADLPRTAAEKAAHATRVAKPSPSPSPSPSPAKDKPDAAVPAKGN